MNSEIFNALVTLNRGSEAIAAVLQMNDEENRFVRTLDALKVLAEEEKIAIAIVGDLGAIHYGYPAATQDIDVAIGKDQLERFVQVAPKYGFKIACNASSGWHTLMHGDVEVNVVPEGRKAKDNSPTTIPSPSQLGVPSGLGYANLPGWTELKISSARQKDQAHIVEVLKKCSDATIEQVRNHLLDVHESYERLFIQLSDQAVDERRQEAERR